MVEQLYIVAEEDLTEHACLQVDLPDKADPTYGIVRCINYTAHLGRWAIPVTREDLDSDKLCGIDGCF